MEEQVTESKQPGAYYTDPNGQRYENPAEFSQAQNPGINFEAMRQEAMRRAIEQINAQRAAVPQSQPQPQSPPPGMELSMDGSQYIPQKYPVAPTPVYQPAPTAQVTEQATEQVRVVRRNLTKPEIAAVFVAACIAVTGVQAVWNFTTNILPRIEIRSN